MSHLKLVPPADPAAAVEHLSMVLANATRTFGEASSCVRELAEKLRDAKRALEVSAEGCGGNGGMKLVSKGERL